MNDNIKNIINDLINNDKSFKENEQKLNDFISDFENIKPDTYFTDEFNNRLRKQILNSIEYGKTSRNEKKLNFFSNRFISGIVLSTLMLITFLGILDFKKFDNNKKNENLVGDSITNYSVLPDDNVESLSMDDSINTKDYSILPQTTNDDQLELGSNIHQEDAKLESIAVEDEVLNSQENIDSQEFSISSFRSIQAPQNSSGFEYTYIGEKNIQDFLTGKINSYAVGKISIDNNNLEQFDFNVFHNKTELIFEELKNDGYYVYYDTGTGIININYNFNEAISSEIKSLDNIDYVKITKDFNSKYYINSLFFDSPEINEYSEHDYVNIFYPFIIDGSYVFDISGLKLGVNYLFSKSSSRIISVDGLRVIKYNIISNTPNITYKEVLNNLKNGGILNNTNQIDLDQVELVYYTKFEYFNNEVYEYLLPALRFYKQDMSGSVFVMIYNNN